MAAVFDSFVVLSSLGAVWLPEAAWRTASLAAGATSCLLGRRWLHYRWQLAPAAVAAMAGGVFLPTSLLMQLPLSALAAASVALSLALPRLQLPAPTGPYRVYRRVVAGLATPTRAEVQIWFPSAGPATTCPPAAKAPYFVHGFDTVKGLAKFAGVPAVMFTHLLGAESAVLSSADGDGVAVAAGKDGFPVLVFSHGLGAVPELYTTLLAEVVSHGAVVVAVTHTGGNACFSSTIDKDGVRHDVPYIPLTREEKDNLEKQKARRSAEVKVRAQECVAALQLALDGHDGEGPLAKLLVGALNPSAVGIFGHSFGGATALQAAWAHPRIKACVALDAWMLPLEPALLETGLRQPTLFQQGDHFQRWEENSSVKRKLVSVCSDESVLFALRRTRHQNFTDMPWVGTALLRYMRSIGRVAPDLAMRVIANETMQFFASHLHTSYLSQHLSASDGDLIDMEKPAKGDLRASL